MELRKTATFALYDINTLVLYSGVESVYSAVRTGSLYKNRHRESLIRQLEKIQFF